MTRNRKMANEIRKWLIDHEMWIDTTIYFDGVAYSTDDGEGHFYYNDPEHLVELPDKNPRDYFEYVNPNHILSMSFEGDLYDVLNYEWEFPGYTELQEEFAAIFHKYGTYYELGDAWNMSVYKM